MNRRSVALALSIVLTAVFAVPLFAGDDAELKKDLTAVIALHGLPCGQVNAAVEQDTMDYTAACTDGNTYRVYVNAEGRVIVEVRK